MFAGVQGVQTWTVLGVLALTLAQGHPRVSPALAGEMSIWSCFKTVLLWVVALILHKIFGLRTLQACSGWGVSSGCLIFSCEFKKVYCKNGYQTKQRHIQLKNCVGWSHRGAADHSCMWACPVVLLRNTVLSMRTSRQVGAVPRQPVDKDNLQWKKV